MVQNRMNNPSASGREVAPTKAQLTGAYNLGKSEALLKYPFNTGALTGLRKDSYTRGYEFGAFLLLGDDGALAPLTDSPATGSEPNPPDPLNGGES